MSTPTRDPKTPREYREWFGREPTQAEYREMARTEIKGSYFPPDGETMQAYKGRLPPATPADIIRANAPQRNIGKSPIEKIRKALGVLRKASELAGATGTIDLTIEAEEALTGLERAQAALDALNMKEI